MLTKENLGANLLFLRQKHFVGDYPGTATLADVQNVGEAEPFTHMSVAMTLCDFGRTTKSLVIIGC